MYCEKCGSENSDVAVYCRKCGAAIASPEEETRVVTRSSTSKVQSPSNGVASVDAPAEIFSISPTLKFVKLGYVGAAIAALLLVSLISLLTSVSLFWAVIVGLLLFLLPAYYHVRQKLVRYTLTDSSLEIDTGMVARSTRNVPIRRIQDVTVAAGPWQRLFGFGDVMIDNASESGGKTVLKNIDTPKSYADKLLEQMRRLEK
jgi:membrane protein YdbS with pleckstrin-like domain